jgi:biotin transporter BioY
MNELQLIVWLVCGLGALALMLAGVFWLGLRSGARQLARELLAREVAQFLAEADDDEEGVAVL